MRLDEYLTRFHLLQHAVEKDERTLELITGSAYRSFFRRFVGSRDPVLGRFLLTETSLRERILRRKRLCERYAARIARACLRIEIIELREYAICHYLYGMTHEDLAERSQFCVRTVYRHRKKARKELEIALLAEMPRVRRIAPARFRVRGRISLRDYAADRVSRTVAEVTARRRKAAPITVGSFYQTAFA